MKTTTATAFITAVLLAEGDVFGQEIYKHQLSVEQRSSGSSSLKEGGTRAGSLRSDDAELSFVERVPLSDAFNLMAGFGYQRAELRAAGAPLPQQLQAASARLGGEWLINSRWWLFINAAPGYYGDNDLTKDDFNVPGNIQANHLLRPGLRLVFGLAVDPFAKSAVTPFAGAAWRLNRRWNLNLLPPKLRVEYRAVDDGNKRVELFSGLSITGGNYRVSGDLGSRRGRPELDGQKLSRQEVGFEGGTSLDWKGLRAELSGGWLFSRRFRYEKSGVELKADGAPFLALSASGRF